MVSGVAMLGKALCQPAVASYLSRDIEAFLGLGQATPDVQRSIPGQAPLLTHLHRRTSGSQRDTTNDQRDLVQGQTWTQCHGPAYQRIGHL